MFLASNPRPLLALVFGFLFVFVSCKSLENETDATQAFDRIGDKQAAELLKNAIQAAGGLNTWNNLKLISFEKRFALFRENGEIEMDRQQTYIQRNDYNGQELMKEVAQKPEISYQLGPDYIRVKGDVNPDMEETALRNSILSASFVISIPFKLLDEGAKLSYVGKDTLDRGQEVEVLQVVYNPENYGNHSTKDTWWHYFDSKTFKHVAYMVQHADHYSYVENLTQTEAGGIVFPLTRKSWRVDEDRNLLWLRAEYEYSDYQVGGM